MDSNLREIERLRNLRKQQPIAVSSLRAALSQPDVAPPSGARSWRDLSEAERAEVLERAAASRAQAEADRLRAERDAAVGSLLAAAELPERHVSALASLQPFPDDTLNVLKLMVTTPTPTSLVAILGHRGPGKTQLAVALIDWWVREIGKSARYWTVPELFIALKAEFGGTPRAATQAIGAGLLVLDEFHTRGDSEWVTQTLDTIVDGRYSRNRPTVLISNETEAVFRQRIGASVSSRLVDRVIDVSAWPSRRV